MVVCNREEAFRAMEIGMKKMENNDFIGAEKILLKAQKLHPEIQNVSQLLTICKVHCAAEVRMNGQMDLYGILQVGEAADEAMIRRQYRKLAFSLHPDKNSFAGAEAAFKLVAEAHSVLCDPARRSDYDTKRRHVIRNVVKQSKQQPSRWTCANQSSVPGSEQTFWTICPYCQIRYQYYSYILNTMVRCINCKKEFFACQLKEYPMPTSSGAPNSNGSQVPGNMFPKKQRNTPSQRGRVKPDSRVPANMFPNQQHVIPNQHGHPSKTPASRDTDPKHEEYSRPGCDAFQFSTRNNDTSSVPTENENVGERSMPDPADPNVVDRQKSAREALSAVPDAMNLPGSASLSSADGKSHGDPRVNVAETNEHVKGCSSLEGEKNAKQSEMIREGVEISVTNKNTDGRSMLHQVDPAGGKNLGREDASTVISAAMSISPHGSARRKQDTDSNICLNSNSNKRQRKDDSDRKSDAPYESSNADVRKKAKTPSISDQGNIKEEATETVSEKKLCYSECVSFPDPDFFDFEKLRDANLFAVGQIWALYDNLDGMPRYYAQIKRLDASIFKVHLTWLEYEVTNEEEEKWIDEELPIACGKFRLGKSRDTTQDRSMFSHIVAWAKGKKRKSFVIYPSKGEVWALYKGWSMEWGSDANNHRSYEYEVVEVLSTMSVDDGATVVPLVKIKGFVSLFATAKDKSSFVIPSSELLRFSHCIPSYRTNGNEKVGVPGGFLELDNACLPVDMDVAFPSVTLDSYMSVGDKTSNTFVDMATGSTFSASGMAHGDEQTAQKDNHTEPQVCHPVSTDNKKDMSSEQNTSPQKSADGAGNSPQRNCPSPPVYMYPDPEFHSFEESRSCDKFERGQIWALYSDLDRFPNFYGWISKVERAPFRVHLIWLEARPRQEQEKRWLEQDIPVSCGTFKVKKFRAKYETNESFSHLVYARQMDTTRYIEILPQAGEIWAVYMNWAPDWIPSSGSACEYAICEVIECTAASSKITFLAQVDGYRSVFKHDKGKGVMEIPATERSRFSHRIPHFHLTEERGGKLRGFYELDPAAVPDVFLYRDT